MKSHTAAQASLGPALSSALCYPQSNYMMKPMDGQSTPCSASENQKGIMGIICFKDPS